MSIALKDGKLRVNFSPWVDITDITPGQWHYVAVAKQADDVNEVRVFVDGLMRYAGSNVHLGAAQTEVVIGASVWRGSGSYGEFFEGAVAQVSIWQGAFSDSQARQYYLRDAPRYQAATLAVDQRPVGLELLGLTPNPATRRLRVSFSLTSDDPARLEVLDLTGRRVRARDVGVLGAGRHVVDLTEGVMPAPGVYWVRLMQGHRALVRKATIVR
jgi:hypothetical protein